MNEIKIINENNRPRDKSLDATGVLLVLNRSIIDFTHWIRLESANYFAIANRRINYNWNHFFSSRAL